MAAPLRFVHLIVWREGCVNFGITLRRFLAAIKKENQFGVALGVYAANLEVEVTY